MSSDVVHFSFYEVNNEMLICDEPLYFGCRCFFNDIKSEIMFWYWHNITSTSYLNMVYKRVMCIQILSLINSFGIQIQRKTIELKFQNWMLKKKFNVMWHVCLEELKWSNTHIGGKYLIDDLTNIIDYLTNVINRHGLYCTKQNGHNKSHTSIHHIR